MRFRDRTDAGEQLVRRMEHLRGGDGIVLGLPRGGVPVAHAVASGLGLPLDVIVVRKLGVPWHQEFAMGAIGDGVRVLDDDVVRSMGVTPRQVEEVETRERAELRRRIDTYRAGRPPAPLDGRTAIIVDDGIATGATARAACRVAREAGAATVVLAVPLAPPDWHVQPGVDADELICVTRPSPFFAIGQWYTDFSQTSDDEVIDLLSAAG